MRFKIVLVIAALWLLTAAVAAFFRFRAKRATERAEASEARERALKANLANIAKKLAQDEAIQAAGRPIVQTIKEAKTDEDAHTILVAVSSELDRLL